MRKINSKTLPTVVVVLLFLVSCNNAKNDLADKQLEEIVSNVSTPFVAVPNQGPGVAFHLNTKEIERMRSLQQTTLHLSLPNISPLALELERKPLPLANDAKLVIDGLPILGGIGELAKGLQLWSGSVAGTGAPVYLALTETMAFGFIEPSPQQAGLHIITNQPGQALIVSEVELNALGYEPLKDFCQGPLTTDEGLTVRPMPTDDPSSRALSLEKEPITIAIETDYELYKKFYEIINEPVGARSRSRTGGSSAGGSRIDGSAALTAYVVALMGAVSSRFHAAIGTNLSIAYLGIHTSERGDWVANYVGDLLNEFIAAWVPGGVPNWPVQADLAHILSGTVGGGFGYLAGLCSQTQGFAASANIGGNIELPGTLGNSGLFKWDVFVVAHELGHNFGSWHSFDTRQYYPALDQCVFDCSRHGTIMSYCYGCAGGMDNIDLVFHERTAAVMREVVEAATCVGNVETTPGGHVRPSCISAADCADGASCTIDSCNAALGCIHMDTCGLGLGCSVAQNSCVPQTTRCFQQDSLPDSGYSGAVDTYLNGRSIFSNGDSTYLVVTGSSTSNSSSLFHWDLSAIPVQATVRSVELTLWGEPTLSDSASQHRYPIYKMNRAWVESEADWYYASYTANGLWEIPGALGATDHDSTAIASILMQQLNTAVTVSVDRGTVQQWIASPASNLGIIIQDHSSTDSLRLRSSEDSSINQRPKLCVTYTP